MGRRTREYDWWDYQADMIGARYRHLQDTDEEKIYFDTESEESRAEAMQKYEKKMKNKEV